MPKTLTHSPAVIVHKLLLDLGEATLPAANDDWPVYYGAEPPVPDNILVVNDTTGTIGGRYMHSGEITEHYGFQVMVRALNHDAAWLKSHALRSTLAESVVNRSVNVDGTVYAVGCISNIGPVLPIGKESPNSKRSLCTINAQLVVREI